MAGKFGVLESTIWRSRKFRPLDVTAKLVYLSAHTSPHRNAIGLFSWPPVFVADDVNIAPDAANTALLDLVTSGLIQYDFEEQIVRVTNWERRNAPKGPQEAIGRVSQNFDDAPFCSLLVAAFLSFTHDILHKAQGTAKGGDGWNDTPVRGKMEKMIFQRLSIYALTETETFIDGIKEFGGKMNDTVFERMFELIQQKNDTLYHNLCDTLSLKAIYGMAYLDQRTLNTEQRAKNTDQRTLSSDQRTESKEPIGDQSLKTSSKTPPSPSPRKSASKGASRSGMGAAAQSSLAMEARGDK